MNIPYKFRKIIAIMLTFIMLISIIPVNAIASSDVVNNTKTNSGGDTAFGLDASGENGENTTAGENAGSGNGDNDGDENGDGDYQWIRIPVDQAPFEEYLNGDEDGEKDKEDEKEEGKKEEDKKDVPAGMFTLFGAGDGTEFEWTEDASNEDLTGVTKVTVRKGATGTLMLVEPDVTIDVQEIEKLYNDETYQYTDIYADAEIVLTESVSAIHLVSGNATTDWDGYPKFSKLAYEGTETLTINTDGAAAFGFEELAISYGGSGDFTGTGTLNVNTVTGQANTFNINSAVTVNDGILATLDTLNVNTDLTIWTQNPNDEVTPNPGIKEVKNINIASGKQLAVKTVGFNNVLGADTPHAVTLADEGKIEIADNGSLTINASSGEYVGNLGGNAIHALGDGTIIVNNGGSLLASGGASGSSAGTTAGVGIYSAGDLLVELYGGNASLIGGSYNPATYADTDGKITVAFHTGSTEYSLALRNGSGFGGEAQSVAINRMVPGNFTSINDTVFDITGDPNTDSKFSVTLKSNDEGEIIFNPNIEDKAVTYTASQIGGTDGTVSTTGILFTFNTGVNGLTQEHITIKDAGNNVLTNIIKGTVTNNGDTDPATWFLPISGDFANATAITVEISDWSGDFHYTIAPEQTEQAITIYKGTGQSITWTAEQVGGAMNLIDSTGILVNFSEAVEGLIADRITLTGGATVTAVAQQGEDAKTWLISIGTSGAAAAGEVDLNLKLASFDDYIFPNQAVIVTIYRKVIKEISYTAEQVGGNSGTADTTAIKVSLSPNPWNLTLAGFTKDQIILKGADGNAVTDIIKSDLTPEGTMNTWLLPISGDFANGQELTIEIVPWVGNYHYTVASSQTEPQKITIYKDARDVLTYTLQEVGGESGKLRTQYLAIKFNKPVAGLEITDIDYKSTVTARYLVPIEADADGKTDTWYFYAGEFGVADKEEFTLIINDWDDYKVTDGEQKVIVHTAGDPYLRFHIEQVGGIDRDKTTESINIIFNRGMENLTLDDFTFENVTPTKLTEVADKDGKVWNLEIKDVTANKTKAKIALKLDPEPYSDYGNPRFKHYAVNAFSKEIDIYLDTFVYVDYSVTVDGIDGVEDTKKITVCFTGANGAPLAPETFKTMSPYSVSINQEPKAGYLWIDDANTYKIAVNVDGFENGDPFTIEFLKLPVLSDGSRLKAVEPEKTFTIHRDTRELLRYRFSPLDGESNVADTKRILVYNEYTEVGLPSPETYTAADFAIDWATIVSVMPQNEGETTGVIVELDDIQFSEGRGAQWQPITVSKALPAGYKYSTPQAHTGHVNVYHDIRKLVTYEIIDVSGKHNEITTGSVTVRFSEDIAFDRKYGIESTFKEINLYRDNNGEKGEKFAYIDIYHRVDINPVDQSGGNKRDFRIRFSPPSNFENGDKFILEIDFRRGVIGQAPEILEKTKTFAAFKAHMSAGSGVRIETISPSIIHKDSKRREFTLTGYFGTGGPKGIKELIFRDKNDRTNEQRLALDHTNKDYSDSTEFRHKLDLSLENIAMLYEPGEYEVGFLTYTNYDSVFTPLQVVDDVKYSTDGYGVLTVTQKNNGEFAVESFPSEQEMRKKKAEGTTLVRIRGNIHNSAEGAFVVGDSVINEAIEYAGSLDDRISIIKTATGVKISSNKGKLKWNGMTIADNGFGIDLSKAKRYKNKRTDVGESVEITSNATDANFEALFIKVDVGTYKLYEDEFTMDGLVGLQGVLPNFMGDAGAYVNLEELILENRFLSGIPPMKANGYLGFQPSELFGDFVAASGALEVELDTLPETNPHYLRAEGEIDISEVIYLQGKFVFKWGKTRSNKMIFMPDTLEFFGRIGSGGVPLVPPIVLGYINGIGGKIENLGEAAFNSNSRIPAIEIGISAAFTDVTGFIASIDKASIIIGPKIFSLSADEVTILKFIKVYELGLAFGLKESIEDPDFLDAFFEAGGIIKLGGGIIEGGGKISAILYGKRMGDMILAYYKELSENKGAFKLPSDNVAKMLYDVFDVYASAYVKAELDIWGAVLKGDAEISGNKTYVSGRAYGYIGGRKKALKEASAAFEYYYGKKLPKIKDVNMSKSLRMMTSEDNRDDKNHAMVEGNGEGVAIVTNTVNVGSFSPNNSASVFGRGMMATNSEPGTNVEAMKAGNIVVILANEKYDVIEIYKDSAEEPILIEGDWEEVEETNTEVRAQGIYRSFYIIPEDGEYRFVADGPLHCNVIELTEIPGFASVNLDLASKTVSWVLDAIGQTSSDNLFVSLSLVNENTGHVETHLASGLNAKTQNSVTYSLPAALESGDYHISVKLYTTAQVELIDQEDGTTSTETVERVQDLFHTEPFAHVNNNGLANVTNIATEYAGNGLVKVTWDAVAGADGYRVELLDANQEATTGMAPIMVGKYQAGEENAGAVKNFVEIQGGLFNITYSEGEDGTDKKEIKGKNEIKGLEFGQEYIVSVAPYKNKSLKIGAEASTDSSELPVYGEKAYHPFIVQPPEIPEIAISSLGAKEVVEVDGSSVFYANHFNPTFEMHFDREITELHVDLDGEEINIENNIIDYTYPEDGHYNFNITAKNGKDEVHAGIYVIIDTKAPLLLVDDDSFYVQDGRVKIDGYAEIGATVTLQPFDKAMQAVNGTFSFDFTTAQEATTVSLAAEDHAGNRTERAVALVYQKGKVVEPEEPDDSGGSGGSEGPIAPKEKEVKEATSIAVGKGFLVIAEAKDVMISADGTITLLGAGALTLANDAVMNLPKGTTITAAGSIQISGNSEGTVKLPSGLVLSIQGGTSLALDETSKIGYTVKPQGNFNDVSAGSWYENDVAFAYAHNLLKGTGENAFSPDITITRGMLVTILGRMHGVSAEQFNTMSFNDVNGDQYYAPYAEWARQMGIVAGIGENRFAPDAPITRQDLAVMFYNYTKFSSMGMEKFGEYQSFNDNGAISGYAMDAIQIFAEADILKGKPGNMLDPKGETTRAESTAILHRFISALK